MEGRCTKCGTLYRIGALEESSGSQVCPYCGAALEIRNNGGSSFTNSLPFTVKIYGADPTTIAPATVHMKPSNSNDINDAYIMNMETKNPYLSGLKRAIEDFKNND
jgi:hypothetical protein